MVKVIYLFIFSIIFYILKRLSCYSLFLVMEEVTIKIYLNLFTKGISMKKLLIASLIIALPSFAFAAGDAAAGKAKSTICATCHGAEGIAIAPIYPNLKGQQEAYIVSSLKAYKADQRKGGMSMLMSPQAKVLSDEDIANLAAYYSAMK